METLGINELALGLLTLGIIFMLAEIVIYTFGILAITGTLFYLIGLTLILASGQEYSVYNWLIIGFLLIGSLTLVIVGVKIALKSFRRKIVTGKEGLLNEIGVAASHFELVAKVGERPAYYKGKVLIHGEIWEAESQSALKEGEWVQVTRMHNLILQVKERGAKSS